MADDLAQLPWLIAHGAWVWKVVAAASAGEAIRLGRRRAYRRAVQGTDAALAARLAQVTAPVAGEVTVRGVLRGGEIASVFVARPGDDELAYAVDAPRRRWVDCDGERVELAGEIRVVRGARPDAARAAAGDGAQLHAPAAVRQLDGWASVDDGHEVLVTARLAPEAGRAATGYRDASTAWRATPIDREHGAAIELFATAPATRPVRLGALPGIGHALAGAALAIAALFGAGHLALHVAAAHEAPELLVPFELPALDMLAIAAAMPGTRDPALRQLDGRLAHDYQRSPAMSATRIAAAELRGCAAGLDARLAEDAIEDLRDRADDCEDARASSRALQRLGWFRRAHYREAGLPIAARSWSPMIATKSWEELGAVYRDLVVTMPAAVVRWRARLRDASDDCRPSLLLSCNHPHWPPPGGFPSMRAWTKRLPANIRDLGLALVSMSDGQIALDDFADLQGDLRRAVLSVDRRGAAIAVALANAGRDSVQRAWQPGFGFAARLPEVGVALFHVLEGRWSHARLEAQRSGDLYFYLAIATRTGHLDADDPHGAWLDQLRAHALPLPLRHALGAATLTPDTERALGIPAALAGDPAKLVAALATHGLAIKPGIELIFALWPALDAHARDALAAQLHSVDPGWDDTPDNPLLVLAHAAVRRDLARLVGDDQAAERWQDIVSRYLEIYTDPDRLGALLLLQMTR